MTLFHYSLLLAVLAIFSGTFAGKQLMKLVRHTRGTELARSPFELWLMIGLYGFVTVFLIGLSCVFYIYSRV